MRKKFNWTKSHHSFFERISGSNLGSIFLRIGNFLTKNLEDIFDNSEERTNFENMFTIMDVANGKEISIGQKAFIVSLKESMG